MMEVYINKEINGLIDYLTDLFCLPERPKIFLSTTRNKGSGTYWNRTNEIVIGCKGGKIDAKVLIHEMLHAAGFEHKDEEYGLDKWPQFGYYSNYVQNKSYGYDEYSDMVCKDIFGVKEKYL